MFGAMAGDVDEYELQQLWPRPAPATTGGITLVAPEETKGGDVKTRLEC